MRTRFNHITAALLPWFATHKRPLAWREPGTTAWGVLLSEVMSQQTPVARVEPQWQAWMRRWPTPTALAAATPAEVLRAWGTLGYPRRALRLHECARTLRDRYEGEVPHEVTELLTLPGIGEYTAHAIACFHFGQNVPVVDTNVRRVLARALDASFLAPAPRKAELRRLAELLPADNGPRVSVALMELGALVCTARKPDCHACPISATCGWVAAGRPEPSAAQQRAAKDRVQSWEGTDRQVRGKIMRLLRENEHVSVAAVWEVAAKREQVERCLESLLADGLAQREGEIVFLPGIKSAAP